MGCRCFPHGPLCSLRRAMLLWLVPLFLAVGSLAAVLSYCVLLAHGERVHGRADAAARPRHRRGTNPCASPRRSTSSGCSSGAPMWCRCSTPTARHGASLPQLPSGCSPPPASTRWSTRKHWRVYTLPAYQPGSRAVQVLQSEGFARQAGGRTGRAKVAPILLLLPLSMFVLWLVARAMSCIQDIGRQAALQDEHSISELELKNIPREIAPLVRSFNSLLRGCAMPSRRSAASSRMRRTSCARRSPRLACRWRTCSDLPPAAEERFTQLEAGVAAPSAWWTSCSAVAAGSRCRRTRSGGPAGAAAREHEHPDRRWPTSATSTWASWRTGGGAPILAALRGRGPAQPAGQPDRERSALHARGRRGRRAAGQRQRADGGGGGGHRPRHSSRAAARVFDRFFRVPGNGATAAAWGWRSPRRRRSAGLLLTLRNREDRSGLIARIEPPERTRPPLGNGSKGRASRRLRCLVSPSFM